MNPASTPDHLEAYARAAASYAQLPIRDEWWPEVLRHLAVLDRQAACVVSHPGSTAQLLSPALPG
jgi:hypothetical protein